MHRSRSRTRRRSSSRPSRRPSKSSSTSSNQFGRSRGSTKSSVTVTVTTRVKDQVAFLVEVKQAGIFEIRGVPEDQMEPLLGIVSAEHHLSVRAREPVGPDHADRLPADQPDRDQLRGVLQPAQGRAGRKQSPVRRRSSARPARRCSSAMNEDLRRAWLAPAHSRSRRPHGSSAGRRRRLPPTEFQSVGERTRRSCTTRRHCAGRRIAIAPRGMPVEIVVVARRLGCASAIPSGGLSWVDRKKRHRRRGAPWSRRRSGVRSTCTRARTTHRRCCLPRGTPAY